MVRRILIVLFAFTLPGCLDNGPAAEDPLEEDSHENGPLLEQATADIVETGCLTAWGDIVVDRMEAKGRIPPGFTARSVGEGHLFANVMARSCVGSEVDDVLVGPASILFLMLPVSPPAEWRNDEAAEHFFVIWGVADQAAYVDLFARHGLSGTMVGEVTVERPAPSGSAHATAQGEGLAATLVVSAAEFGEYGVFTTRFFGWIGSEVFAMDQERMHHRAAPFGNAVVRLDGAEGFAPGLFAGYGRLDLWDEDAISYRWRSSL